MSHTNVCRLCLNICKDCKSLYCAAGQINDVYDIAVKYFHPMFLCGDEKNHNTVMCMDCWHHISDFHSYQQSVLHAQRRLLEEESQMEFLSGQYASASGIDNPIKKEEDEDSMSLPDLELMEEDCSVGIMVQNVEIETTHNLENSDNIAAGHCAFYNVKHEVGDIPATTAELPNDRSIDEDNIMEGNANVNTGSNQLDVKRKQGYRKSQTELDSFISQWRPKLACVICGIQLTSFALLQHHFCQKHPTDKCYISCCNRKFNTRAKIEEHARFHIDPNAFKCLKCGSKLGSEASLYTHNRRCNFTVQNCETVRKQQRIRRSYTKTPLEEIDNFIALYKPNLECEVCHESCSSFTLLKTHFRKQHPGEEGYATCCQRKFISRSAFKEHIWLHMDPNAFKCNICDRNHSSYTTLQTHMERVHSVPQKIVRLKDISICAQTQPNRSSLPNEQINLQHLSLESTTIAVIAPQKDLNITGEVTPKTSQEIKANGNSNYNEFDEILSVWKPILACEICGESCRTYAKLQDHFRTKHPKTQCYFICCTQQLKSRPEIEQHMRLHRNMNVYKCHICINTYKSRQTLREHMLLQHPELRIHK